MTASTHTAPRSRSDGLVPARPGGGPVAHIIERNFHILPISHFRNIELLRHNQIQERFGVSVYEQSTVVVGIGRYLRRTQYRITRRRRGVRRRQSGSAAGTRGDQLRAAPALPARAQSTGRDARCTGKSPTLTARSAVFRAKPLFQLI